MSAPSNTRQRGLLAERLAQEYLTKQGLHAVTSNYRSPRGEIDLIMRDGDVLVFVEVRSRASNAFVHAAETIDRRKRDHIIRAGRHYLQSERRSGDAVCRFDVIVVTGDENSRKIEWIKNAFDA